MLSDVRGVTNLLKEGECGHSSISAMRSRLSRKDEPRVHVATEVAGAKENKTCAMDLPQNIGEVVAMENTCHCVIW